MKTIKEKDYKLLKRKSYIIEFPHDKKSSPKNEEMKKEVASFLKVPEDQIAIKHIYTNYGTTTSKIEVNVYHSKEDLEKIEIKNKKPKKKKGKKAAKPKK